MLDPQAQAKIDAIMVDAKATEDLVRQGIAAYKKAGVQGLITIIPGATDTLKKDFTDVEAIVPVVKVGYKTTEFWLAIGIGVINFGYLAITGKAIPFDINGPVVGLIAIYTAVRGMTKATAPVPTAASTSTTTPSNTTTSVVSTTQVAK